MTVRVRSGVEKHVRVGCKVGEGRAEVTVLNLFVVGS